MKRYLLVALVICGLLAFASTGWSLTMADVGSQDTLFNNTTAIADLPNSGTQTELDWVNSVLGTSFTADVVTITTAADWTAVDGTNFWAFSLQTDPAYFFIKTGAKPGDPDHFLFTNNDSLDWAVIALSDLNIESVTNVGKISHVGEVGGTSVPEPGMLMLFGTGLLGLGIFGRKKFGK